MSVITSADAIGPLIGRLKPICMFFLLYAFVSASRRKVTVSTKADGCSVAVMTQSITLRAAFATYPHVAAIKSGAVTSPLLRFDLEEVANITRAFRRMVRTLDFDRMRDRPDDVGAGARLWQTNQGPAKS